MINKIWKEFKGKKVRLIVEDFNSYPKPKDGVFIDCDETHIFLLIESHKTPIPFLKTSIKRIDIKEIEEQYGNNDNRGKTN